MKRITLVTLLLALAIILGCSSDPNEPENLSPWEEVSEHAINPSGGIIQNDGISVGIPTGAFPTASTIILQKATAQDFPLEDPRAYALSNIYRLNGVPEFSEPLTLTLTFDPADLPAENACFIYLEEECFVSAEGNWVQRGRPLSGSVTDRENGTVTALLLPDTINPAKLDTPILRNFTITAATATGFEARANGGDFEVTWLRGQVDEAWISDLVHALEDAMAKLEELGMQFTNAEGDAIEVQVRPLKAGLFGEFVQSKRGINASYLQISPTISGDQLRATAGHELFHLLQMCYGACGHYFGYDYEWLCEAASTWFEPVFLDNPDFPSSVAEDNRNFILQPLETEDPEHGYGASRFMLHITDQLGDAVMSEIMLNVSAQEGGGTGAAAVAQMLSANGTNLSETFTSFARKYLTTNTGHTGWGTSDPEVVILTPSRPSRQISLPLADLSAKHANTALNWGDNTTWGKLTIALNADASEHVKGFVYHAASGGGPWTLGGELRNDDAYVIPDFGRNQMAWTKVLVLRAEGVEPFNQSESIFLNYDFEPQDGFPVRSADINLHLDGTLVSGESISLWFDFASWDAVMLSEDTFKIELATNGQPGNWERHDFFQATIDFSNQRITSWLYRGDFYNRDLELRWEAMVRGGEVGAYWQNDVSAEYVLRGQEVCDGMVEMSYVRTINGVEDARLDAPLCDVFNRVEIMIRD